jgi:hypothetical protein
MKPCTHFPTIVFVFLAVIVGSPILGAEDSAKPKYSFPIDVSWLSPLFIDARVNGSEPMRFIVDSASTYSMIRKAEAQKLGLKTSGGATLSGGGGQFDIEFAKADLQVGDFKLNGIALGLLTCPLITPEFWATISSRTMS